MYVLKLLGHKNGTIRVGTVHYAFGKEVMFLNICCLISLLASKGYPKQWWKPLVLAKCHTIGLSNLAFAAVRRLMPVCP